MKITSKDLFAGKSMVLPSSAEGKSLASKIVTSKDSVSKSYCKPNLTLPNCIPNLSSVS